MSRQAPAPRPPRSRPGRVATAELPLTRERIVAAGLALLAKRGANGISMRALADALGAAPMSLYRHVHSKDDLLNGIVTMVLDALDLELPERGPWTERAAAWMHGLRNQLLQSPAVVPLLLQHGHYAPALLRATNTLLRILRDAEIDGGDAVRACREITWSTLAFVSAEIRGPTFSPAFYLQAMGGTERAPLPPDDVSEIAALMPHFLTRDLDEIFSFTVKHLLVGLEAERVATAGRRNGDTMAHAAGRGGHR